jgi:hypothetical protein
MSDLYLDLKDRVAMVDFMLDAVEYVESNPLHERVSHLADAALHGGDVSTEALEEAAREVARASFPARIAVKRYIKTSEGKAEEWRRIVAAVSNSTGHLLERFRSGIPGGSLDDVLSHEESGLALRDAERLEINEVRSHALASLWRDKKTDLAASANEAKTLLDTDEGILAALRRFAFDRPSPNADEIESKVRHYEDRIYYEGEEVDPEILQQEVVFYRNEQELAEEIKEDEA